MKRSNKSGTSLERCFATRVRRRSMIDFNIMEFLVYLRPDMFSVWQFGESRIRFKARGLFDVAKTVITHKATKVRADYRIDR